MSVGIFEMLICGAGIALLLVTGLLIVVFLRQRDRADDNVANKGME